MKITTVALAFTAMMTLAGCAVAPRTVPPEIAAKANYGTFDEKAARAKIKDHLNRTLIDPYSAMTSFEYKPAKHWATDDSGKYHFGWIVRYEVNAKNRMGGYTGAKTNLAFFENNELIEIYELFPSGDGVYPDFRTVRGKF